MSVDASPPLEREALQRKDRDELQTIAEALGGKPGSRARKADIVDMILELAGVTVAPNGDDSATTAEPAPPDADGNQADDESSAATATAGDDAADPVVTEDADADGTTGDSEPAVARSGGRTARGGGDSQSRQQTQNRSRTEERGGDRGARTEQPRDDQRLEPAGDEADQANRRRRRRGRNREGAPFTEEFTGEPVDVEGILDVQKEGFGFLRVKGLLASKDDVYVSVKQVRQFGLRRGDQIKGASRPAFRNEKNPALLRVDSVNDKSPETAIDRPRFEDLTPLFPDERLPLEVASDPTNMTARIVDLLSPIGKGQRGLIVSPPKAGKTTIMKQIARSIETNNPEVELIVLLVDERPEEVTDMRRWVKGEVVGSTFDRPTEEHCQVAELTIERAKRMVEDGKDVVIILDGITRLARAYNLAAPTSGRIMSGGIDTGALYPPKKFFGAARNIEEGGSLTILATALIETGSKMDEVIFEEFKGTGNMELRLDRKLAERRIYPAIDVDASSTRHEELLFPQKQLNLVWKLRRVLSGLAGGPDNDGRSGASLELLIDRMKTFPSNDQFLAEISKAPGG